MATPSNVLFQYLDTVGDGSGTKNANGDYTTPDDFIFKPARNVEVHRMIISVGDTTGFTAQEYGNLGSALSNGWELKVYDHGGTELLDMTAGLPVTTNAEIGRICYDVDVKSWGAGNELLLARWTFTRTGSPLRLWKNCEMRVELSDNMTGLLSHYFMIQGQYTAAG